MMTCVCAKLVSAAHANHFIKSYWTYFCVFSCSLFEKLRLSIVSKSWKSLRLPNIVIFDSFCILTWISMEGWGHQALWLMIDDQSRRFPSWCNNGPKSLWRLKWPPIIEPHVASNTTKLTVNQPNRIIGTYKLLLFIIPAFGNRLLTGSFEPTYRPIETVVGPIKVRESFVKP